MNLKSFGLVSSFALVTALSTPAFAQDDSSGEPEANRTNEIIVTAEFREARLQDTPIAITAVNSEMLEARGATDVAAIAAQAPNVVLKPQGQASGTGLIAYIRGVGQTDFIYARDPGVGVYIDDVYIPTLQSSLIELMDLERVEVLRGPQGTLAGKNSIGGSIKLFGKKPTGNDSGSLEVSYGSFNDIRLRGFADFAVTDNMAVRISGMSRSTDGYVTFLDYGLTHPTSNVPSNQSIGQFPTLGKAGGRTITAGRVALNYDPVDNLNIYVTADYTSQRGDPGAEVLIAAGAPGAGFNGTGQNPAVSFSPNPATPIPWLVGKNGQPVTVGCQFVPYGAYSCDTPPAGYDAKYISYANYLDASPASAQAPYKPYFAIPEQNFEGWGIHGTLTYDISDQLQLVWISSYRKYTSTWGNDNDLTPVPVQQLNNINRHHAWSQELRLNFELADGLVDGTVGGFYFDQYGEYEARVDLNYVNPTIDFIHGPDETPSKSKAVFANINVHPTEALTITGGIRYSDETKDYVYYRRNPDYTKVSCPPGPPSFSIPNCLVNGFFGTLGAFAKDRFDYRGVVNYRISPALMLYASIATGFKGGGVNPRPFIPDQALPFNPETLTTYEGGFKADLMDRRLRLNGAVFFNKYKDVQGTKLACPESALVQPCARPDNVGDAEMKGFELETQILPVDGLSIDGSLAYLDFEYTSAVNPATGTLVNTSIPASAVTPFTPKWTWSIGTQYDYDLASGSRLSFRLDGSYQSKIYANSENSFFGTIDSYFLLNGRVAFSSPDDKWQVYGELKNITDKYYFLTKVEATSAGTVVGQPGIPRTWTVGIKRKF